MVQNPRGILTLKQFGDLQRAYAAGSARRRADLKEKYESNAEVQRNRAMSREERARRAVDTMTGKIKEFNDAKAGRDTTEREARQKAEQLAERANRDR